MFSNQMADSEVNNSVVDRHRFVVLILIRITFHFWCRLRSGSGSRFYPMFYTCWKIRKKFGFPFAAVPVPALFKLSRQRHRGQSDNILDRKKHSLALHLVEMIRIPDRQALDADPDPQHWSWHLQLNKIQKGTYQNGAADYTAVRDPFFPFKLSEKQSMRAQDSVPFIYCLSRMNR